MSKQATEQDHEQSRRWGILFIVLPILGVLCLAILLFFQGRSHSTTSEFIPVNLHSQLEADYLANPHPMPILGVSLDLIWDTLYDREPGATDLEDRQATLLNGLLTPVPTVTPSLSTCQGIHFIYADQDTWIESAHPTATHGSETLLQIGHDGNNTKRLLLHFPLEDIIPQNTLIHSARLEMDVEQTVGTASPESLVFFNLTGPFGEINTSWSNQPEPNVQYQASELALGSIHVWDVTDIVRDWLESHSKNEGIALEPQALGDFTFVYYSREIISQVNSKPNSVAIPVGPRLVINCGGELPQAVAINLNTPTPTATSSQPTPTRELAKPTTTSMPLPTPTLPLPTLAPPLPSPTVPLPTSTLSPLPTSTQAPPMPTLAPPTNTPSPPQDDDDDDGGGGTSTPRARANLALSITDSSDPVIAGNNLTYILTITNNGPNNATQVTITDALPPGVSLISATVSQGTGCSGTSTVICNLGSIANGNRATVIIIVAVNSSTSGILTTSATVSANENDPTPGNNSATETTLVNSVADLTLTKTDSVDPIVAGGSLTYTLTISNMGPSDATGVILTDTLPISTMFVSASTGCMQSGGTITCSLGNLTAASSRQITVGVTVNPAVADGIVINNTATVSGAEPDPIPGNNTAIEPTTINKVADLAISKAGTPDPVIAGQLLTYTLTLSNVGPSNATGVILTDTLPAGVTFASASAGCANAGIITCTIGNLSTGASLQRTIVVTVNASTTANQANTATVGGNETDPIPGNNTDTIITTVQIQADLAISKADTPDPVVAGQLLTYTLTITNLGSSNATGVTLTDTLPAGVTFASAAAGCINTSGTVTCTIGGLTAGSSLQRTIVVTVNASTITNQSNTVTIAGNETDPNGGNNSDTTLTSVQTETDLAISKADTPDPVIAGQLLTYTLTITNIGPSNATGVVLTDTLPAGVTFTSASAGCANTSGTVTCTMASLSAGASVQQTIVVTVNSGATGSLSNSTVVNGNENDPAPGNNSDTITTTVIGSANLGLTKQDSSDPVVPGSTFTYTVVAINNGPSNAMNVSVSDTLPLSVSLVSSSTTQGTGCSGSGSVTCNLGTLTTNATATITLVVTVDPAAMTVLVNTANVTGTTTDPDSLDNTVTENTDIGVLAITKTSGAGGPLNPGQIFTYTLVVENIGSAVETNVTISDTLPPGLSYVPGSTLITAPIISTVRDEFNAIAYNGNNGTDNWSADWLEMGEATNPTGGQVQVVTDARCAASNCARIGGLNVLITGFGLRREADLSGARSAFLTFSYRRQLLLLPSGSMNVEASNNGGGSWTNLKTYSLNGSDSAQIPQSFDITPYTASDTQLRFLGGGGLIASHFFADDIQIQYSKGVTTMVGGPPSTLANGFTLMPGDVITVTFQVQVDNPLTPTITAITNTASVTSDLQITPLSDSVTDAIQQADLTLSKSDSPDPVTAGQTLTYTLSITNNGPSAAQNVVVTDTLPFSVTINTVAPPTSTQIGPNLGWNFGTLSNGATRNITLTVIVNSGLSGVLTNTAQITSTTTDPTPGNNTATATTTAGASVDLAITKSDSPDPALVGQPIRYTLQITKNGPGIATGVVVSDILPAGVTFGSATASQGSCSQAGGIVTCNLGSITSTGTIVALSTFDTNADGWRTTADAIGNPTPGYSAIAGNPGGHIFGVDGFTGISFYFEAPAKFLGNQSATYGGSLAFDLQRSANIPDPPPRDDLFLIGGGLTLRTSIATPGTSWTSYTVPLVETNWINDATGLPPTQAQMLTVLSSLTVLRIMGEYSSDAGDSGYLDNVMLTTGTTNTTVTIVVTPSITGTMVNTATVNANEPDPNLSNNTATASTTVFESGLSINDVTVTEGDSGTTAAVFTVTLSVSSTQVVTVTYTTAEGTARSDDFDYNAITNTLTFPPGTTVQTLTVLVNGDILEEVDEIFFVTLSNPINAALTANNQGTGTILNDDNDPTMATVCSLPTKDTYFRSDNSNNDHSAETSLKVRQGGNKRHTVIEFNLAFIPVGSNVLSSTLFLYEEDTQNGQTIHLHRITNSWVDSQVNWDERSAGVPWNTPGGDYIITTTVASFTPDISNQYRQINVTSVTQGWLNATFANYGLLLLSTGSNGEVNFKSKEESNPNEQPKLCVTYTLPQAELAVTKIVSNPTPNIASTLVFTVTVTNNSPASATGAVISDTLPSGLTYIANIPSQGIYTNTTGVWSMGSIAASTSATLIITTTINTGTLGTTITNTATISSLDQIDPLPANNTASVVITPTLPALSITDTAVTEGNIGTTPAVFTITLSTASALTVTTNYSTSDSTATTADNDYIPISGTLTFTPGIITQFISVTVVGDVITESTETFTVTLSSPINATIADGEGIGTIFQDIGGFALPPSDSNRIFLPLIMKLG